MKIREVMDELAVASAVELFDVWGLTLATSAEGAADYGELAIIGFSSDGIRGALGMAIDRRLTGIAAEAAMLATGDSDDFIAEASNQLLGRLKNKLLRYGSVLSLSTPMVLRGVAIHPAGPVWTYAFKTTDGLGLTIWLDVRTDAGFELSEVEHVEDESAAREGELMIF